jgi:hypothetical protein
VVLRLTLTFGLFVSGLTFCLWGLVWWYLAYQDYQLRKTSSAEPQAITCRALIDKGPGENVNVVLTDYQFLGDQFVVRYHYDKGDLNKPQTWDKVWIPVVPADEVKADAQKVAVILGTRKISSAQQLQPLEKAGRLEGMVVNDISSLPPEEVKLLRKSYPQVDFSKCWIIEHERTHEGTTRGILIGSVCGLSLVLIGLVKWVAAVYAFRRLKTPDAPKAQVDRRPLW